MILTVILMSLIFTIAIIALVAAILSGISFVVAFGDVIVFGLLIFLIIGACSKK